MNEFILKAKARFNCGEEEFIFRVEASDLYDAKVKVTKWLLKWQKTLEFLPSDYKIEVIDNDPRNDSNVLVIHHFIGDF